MRRRIEGPHSCDWRPEAGLGKHQILHREAASSPAAADRKLEVQIAKLCADNNQLSWAQLHLIDIRLGGNKINLYIQSKSNIN